MQSHRTIIQKGKEDKPSLPDDRSMVVCQCLLVLDPYPSAQSKRWYSSGGLLQHYCRVCNTQLNSCKQVRIHVTGKKHEKRCAFLKFSLETSEGVLAMQQQQMQQQLQMQALLPDNFASQCLIVPSDLAANANVPLQLPPFQQPQPPAGLNYFYPHSFHLPPPPPPLPPLQSFQPQATAPYAAPPFYSYDYYPAVAAGGVAGSSSINNNPVYVGSSEGNNSSGGSSKSSSSRSTHPNVMSPGLTSGFSGSSGADCKSAETSSILSAASYSSCRQQQQQHHHHHHHHHHHSGDRMLQPSLLGNGSSSRPVFAQGVTDKAASKSNNPLPFREQKQQPHHHHNHHNHAGSSSTCSSSSCSSSLSSSLSCGLCQVSFPSQAVLKSHLDGARHTKRAEVTKINAVAMTTTATTTMQQQGGGGEDIRCEVCQVSVNSSQQLQAHLGGYKHRVRCLRQSIDPAVTAVTAGSSGAPTATPTSSRSPSESSFAQLTAAAAAAVAAAAATSASAHAAHLCPNRMSLLGHPLALMTARRDIRTSLLGTPEMGRVRLAIPRPPPLLETKYGKSKGYRSGRSSSNFQQGRFVQPMSQQTTKRDKRNVKDVKDEGGKIGESEPSELADQANGFTSDECGDRRPGDTEEEEEDAGSSSSTPPQEKLIQTSPMLDMFLQTLEPHQYFDEDAKDKGLESTETLDDKTDR